MSSWSPRSGLFAVGGHCTRPWEYQEAGGLRMKNPKTQLLGSHSPGPRDPELSHSLLSATSPCHSGRWASSLLVCRPQQSPQRSSLMRPVPTLSVLWGDQYPWEASTQPSQTLLPSTGRLCVGAGGRQGTSRHLSSLESCHSGWEGGH